MTKTKSTKRALLTSALALLMCVSMLIGSTFAWFTDSVTSSGNIIKSGTLDVTMEWADGTKAVPADDSSDWTDASKGAIFKSELWEPGYTEVRHIKIANEGTLALKYQLNIIANGEVSKLADVIDVYYVDPAVQVADRTALTDNNKLGTLSAVLEQINTTASGNLLAGEKDTITLALKMQEDAGNEYQNLAIGSDFSIQLLATQLTSESDSFNNQYDDIVLVSDATALADAIAAGENVMLTSDVALDVNGKAMTVAADADVIIDLNGNDIVGTTTVTGASQILFEVKGELTVVGDGTIALYDKSGAAFNDAYENAAIYVNGGVANLNEGMIVTVSDGAAMAYAADAVGGNSVINVNGATLYSSYIGIRSFPTASGKTNTVNYNSGVVYGGKNGYDIWTQAGSGSSVVNIADGISYIREDQWGGMYYVGDDVAFVSNYAGLTEAIENGGEVVLVNDIVMNNSASLSNADFVLDGNGHTITMADGATNTYALFDITGGKATIKNVSFDGIKDGAIVRTVGVEFNADNVTAVNGNHTQVQGIFRLMGKSTIENCTFKNNVCNMVISLNYDGANNDPQVVKNCVFEKNTCNATAVVYYVKGASATVDGNKFVENNVTVTGASNAATLYMGFQENTTITNNVFENNTVNGGTSKRVAGAIMIGYEAVITGNSFVGNKVTGENAKANDVAAAAYYTDIDLSGNYWGGSAPVENDDYYNEYPNNYSVIIDDYLTTYSN